MSDTTIINFTAKERKEVEATHDKWGQGEVTNAEVRMVHRKMALVTDSRHAASYRPAAARKAAA